jgi:hypothetical protein
VRREQSLKATVHSRRVEHRRPPKRPRIYGLALSKSTGGRAYSDIGSGTIASRSILFVLPLAFLRILRELMPTRRPAAKINGALSVARKKNSWPTKWR